MAFGNFISEMVILYLIGFAGFAARKTGLLGVHANQVLTQLILHLTLPALIIYTLDIPFSLSKIAEFGWLALMSVCIILIATFIGRKMCMRANPSSDDSPVYESLIIFGNQGFIGYAVSYILFQEQGVIYLTMFNICYLIHIWAYGIFLFTRNANKIPWRAIWLNPGTISTAIGFILFITPVTLPNILAAPFETVGQMTIPLSMLVIGSLIANVEMKHLPHLLRNPLLWKAAIARLVIIPLCLLPFFLLPVPFVLLVIAILVSGMPAAPTISLYAEKYGGNATLASAGTLLTTLLCIGTLPLLHELLLFLHLFR